MNDIINSMPFEKEADKKVVSLLSHELRGAFNNILSMSNFILKEKSILDNDLKELIKSIRNTADKSYNILDNLMHLSRISKSNLMQFKSSVDVEMLIRDILDLYKYQIDQKELMIVLSLKKNLKFNSIQIVLSYIVRNLVSNAIKYSNIGGRIEISTLQKEDIFELKVRDYGIGMNDQKINQIFQNDSVPSLIGTSGEFGKGIGLKLCFQYVKKMKGDIVIKSEKGLGTNVIIKLPQ